MYFPQILLICLPWWRFWPAFSVTNIKIDRAAKNRVDGSRLPALTTELVGTYEFTKL